MAAEGRRGGALGGQPAWGPCESGSPVRGKALVAPRSPESSEELAYRPEEWGDERTRERQGGQQKQADPLKSTAEGRRGETGEVCCALWVSSPAWDGTQTTMAGDSLVALRLNSLHHQGGPFPAVAPTVHRSPSFRGLVNFEDVAVYFSREEWGLLNLTQRSLYRDVMLENFALVGSLGFAPARSHVFAQLEDEEEPWLPNNVSVTLISRTEARRGPGLGCLGGLGGAEAPPKPVTSHRRHLSEEPFTCGEAGENVPAPVGLLQRQAARREGEPAGNPRHREAVPPRTSCLKQQEGHTPQRPFKCSSCGEAFLKAFSLLDHLITHLKERPFRGIKGRNTPKENPAHVNHRKTHTGETSHACIQCGKTFSYPSKLRKHQKVHTGVKPFKCSDCGKTFNRKDALVLHQRIHTGERPYECSECGKAFSVLSTLIRHRRVHIGERPYECRECGKLFKYHHSFLLHQRVHTGVRPYECKQCAKTYVTRSGLYQHWKVHTGERPYECSLCGKTFTTRSYRNRHQQFHTEQRAFECTECGKAFKHSSTLLQHKKVHTGRKP